MTSWSRPSLRPFRLEHILVKLNNYDQGHALDHLDQKLQWLLISMAEAKPRANLNIPITQLNKAVDYG